MKTDRKENKESKNLNFRQLGRKVIQDEADKTAIELLLQPLTDPEGTLCNEAEMLFLRSIKEKDKKKKPN